MNSEVLLQLGLRLLPSLIVMALAIVAAGDPKSRQRWADLLYQLGSIRPEQRSDPKVQNGVRLPFFIVALLLLAWPINYYRHATGTLEVASDLYTGPARPSATTTPAAAPGSTPAANGTALPLSSTPAAVTPGVIAPPSAAPTSAAPAGRVNLYGTPVP